MEKERPDYEKMAEEYAKITPFAVREEKKEKPSRNAALLYARISSILDLLPEQNAAKELVLLSKKTAFDVYERLAEKEKDEGSREVERPIINGRLSYTTAVRQALILSAKAMEEMINNGENSLVEYQYLHLLLLSLTAF